MPKLRCDNPECQVSSSKFLKLGIVPCDNTDGQSYMGSINKDIIQTNIAIEELGTISRQICKQWISIQNSLSDDLNIPIESLITSRNRIDEMFHIIINNLNVCRGSQFSENYVHSATNEMKRCSALVLSICEMDDESLKRLARASMDNPKCPVYIYFHTFLDIQHYLLMLSILCGKSLESIEEQLQQIMKDLIRFSRLSYDYYGRDAEVFTCCCDKHFWLSLQMFIETTYASSEIFWKQFNIAVEKQDPNYILWLLKDIALLYRISKDEDTKPAVNFDLLESTLKQIILNRNTTSLDSCLKYMEPLLNDVWLKSSRIEIYQLMWDYFSKRMNSRFVDVTVYGNNAVKFSELIDTLLWCSKDCKGDFLMFISFLIRHLREHPHHWAKIKGRIYSQLNPHKVRDLSVDGIFNVMLLYFCLLTINPDELTKKIISVVEALPDEKKHTEILWNVLICFMLRQVKDGKSISIVSSVMVGMLQEASDDSTKFWLVKIFISGFQKIIENSRSMQLQQWSLINAWLNRYLLSCYYNDLDNTLNILIRIIDRVKEEHVWPEWEVSFKDCIYPTLKQIANTSSSLGVTGRLSAKISILCPALSTESFNYFNSENMSAKISSEYLCELLEDYPNNCILSPTQENMAVQTWIKTCILTVDGYEKLTKNIIKIDSFLQTIKSKLISSEDPFIVFVEHLGSNLNEYRKCHDIIKLCEACFGETDRWISQYFIQPDNEAIVRRAYHSIALTFVNCASLLYDRNKATCPLARLITSLLLPTEFMMGKSLHPFILNGVKATWHIYVESIVKLNRVSDSYLDRTLRDLVVKYLPHFSSSDSPIIKCLDDDETAGVVLDKISLSFFKYPTRESDANVLKALKMINDYVLSTTSIAAFKQVIKKCLHNIFEVIMFHNQRNTAISLLKNITLCPLHIHAKPDTEEAIITITEKHMAFTTAPYFQLMNVLAKFIPNDLQSVIARVEQHLSKIERMRGVGSDKVLRLHFEKLQNTLRQNSA